MKRSEIRSDDLSDTALVEILGAAPVPVPAPHDTPTAPTSVERSIPDMMTSHTGAAQNADTIKWREAPCRDHRTADPDWWFAEARDPGRKRAIELCRSACPFIADCLALAMANREEWGVWGGTVPKSRRKMMRAARNGQPIAPPSATAPRCSALIADIVDTAGTALTVDQIREAVIRRTGTAPMSRRLSEWIGRAARNGLIDHVDRGLYGPVGAEGAER